MKSQAMASRRRVLGGWIGAALASGLLLGAADAWMTRPAYLLEVVGETVENKGTAALQYWHAMKLNTEEAWLAVERYFPPALDPLHRVYAWQAKQRLAEFYRDNGQPEKAMQLYAELADSNETLFASARTSGESQFAVRAA